MRNSNVMIVETADGTGWAAMAKGLVGSNSRSGKWEWSELRHPPGIRPRPIMSGDTIALLYKGKQIDEVSVFSGKTAKWSTQRLREPVKDDLVPVVSDGCALYQAGNDLYAFSTSEGRWDVLSLRSGEKPKVISLAATSWSCRGTDSTCSTSWSGNGRRGWRSSCLRKTCPRADIETSAHPVEAPRRVRVRRPRPGSSPTGRLDHPS